MDKYYQVNIFGEKVEIINSDNIIRKKNILTKIDIFASKLNKLYELYEHLYNLMEIDILEQKEIIIKNNIIAYPEHRQAEPINLAKIDNFIDIKDTKNIEKKIVIMKEIIENYEKRD